MNKLESTEQLKDNVNVSGKDPVRKQIVQGVEFYQKLCLKLYYTPNTTFVSSIKLENLKLYLDQYTLKDMNLINKTVAKFHYFRSITISSRDPNSKYLITSEQPRLEAGSSSTKVKSQDQREREGDIENKFYHISQGVSRNIIFSEIILLKILYLEIKPETAEFLSAGIKDNKTIKTLVINHCHFKNSAFDVLLKSAITHQYLEHLDLSNNNLNDKCDNAKEEIKNEKPFNNDYSQGLISIDLSNNNLSDVCAEELSTALLYDAYIRSIDLSNNQITVEGCKKLIHVMRKNISLLNLDLRGNPGYLVDNIQKRIVLKLAKNIKFLKKMNLSEFEMASVQQFINYELFDLREQPIKGFTRSILKKNTLALIDNYDSIMSDSNMSGIKTSQNTLASKIKKHEERSFSSRLKLSKQNSLQNTMKIRGNETTDSEGSRKAKNGNCSSCLKMKNLIHDLEVKYERIVKENDSLKQSVKDLKLSMSKRKDHIPSSINNSTIKSALSKCLIKKEKSNSISHLGASIRKKKSGI